MSQTSDPWSDFRQQMPVTAKWAYLDHAAVGPISLPAHEAITQWARQSLEEGDTAWPGWNRRLEEVRTAGAQLLGADLDEVALIRNTTEGINLVAEGYPWQSGDNVVTLVDEYPSNLYPWLNLDSRGVETRRVKTDEGRLDLEQLEAACDAKTRIVSISWVGYATGCRHNLHQIAEIVHRCGALLFVDAIQALGIFPLDVSTTPIDFLSADGHKWMLGPEGAGLMFVRREHLDRLRPLGVGWNSVENSHDFTTIHTEFKHAASRYEGGSHNMVGFLALGASLELLLSLGTQRIAERVLEISDEACLRLSEVGARIISHRQGECRSGIVAFEMPDKDPNKVRHHCLNRGIALATRAGRLRISPHAYNNSEDLDLLSEALREIP